MRPGLKRKRKTWHKMALDSVPPRLNWFSPLPPDRSGIANYTAALAPLLRQRGHVRFIAQSEQKSSPFAGAMSLAEISWADINLAEINVFNLGNNTDFHDEIWRFSTQSGGIAILHDSRMQHFFGGLYLVKRRDREGYLRLMCDTYGAEGQAAGTLAADGRISVETISELFPLLEPAICGASGVIVHSEEALQGVRERSRIPVLKLGLPYDAGDLPQRRPCSERRFPLNVVTFGHIGPNRRIESIIKALAGMNDSKLLRLHVIGQVWADSYLRDLASQLGVAESIKFHGHLSENRLVEHLRQAELVVNLRWPTMGEASYSQLMAFRYGVPTVVTRAGWYGELPEDVVFHISPTREVAELRDAFECLIRNPELYHEAGLRGWRLLAWGHSTSNYVDQVITFGLATRRIGTSINEMVADQVARELHTFDASAIDLILDALPERMRSARNSTKQQVPQSRGTSVTSKRKKPIMFDGD